MAVTTPVNSGYTIINGTTTGSNGSKVNTWLEYKVTAQSVANNTSTVRVILYSQATWDSGTAHLVTGSYGHVAIDSDSHSYSMSGGYDFGDKKLNKFADHTFTVTHGTDGKKTVTISGAWSDRSSYITGGSASASVTLPQIARASTVSSLSTTLGTAGTITITRQDSSFTHTLQYSFDNSSWTNIATGVGTSYSWAPSVSLISNFRNSKTKTGYIRCITYSGGTQVGTSTSTLTLTAPSSSLANVNGNYGSAVTLTATNACASGLTYTYQYYNGSSWVSIATGSTSKTQSWTPPTSLIANVSNSKTGTVSIRVTTYVGSATVNTATATATLTIPASTGQNVTGVIGSAISIPITKKHSQLTTTIRYSFGSLSNQSIVTKTTSTTYSWSPSSTVCTNLLNQIPNATTGVGTITLESFNGTASLGTTSYTLTLTVASTVVPTLSIGTPTMVNSNATVSGWGVYLQGYSQVKIALTANGVSGSTISRMSLTGQGMSSTSTPGTSSATLEPTSSVFSVAGTFTYEGNATDSRGRAATKVTSSSITVLPYTAPLLNNVSIGRCDSTGAGDTSGTYLRVQYTPVYESVGNRNRFTAYLQYKATSDTAWTEASTALDGDDVLNLNLSISVNFQARIRYYDSLSGNKYSNIVSIPSDARIINVSHDETTGEDGLAIGGFSTDAGKLQVYYPTDFEGSTLPTINGENFVKADYGYNLYGATKLPFTCDLNDITTAGIYYTNTGNGFTISNLPPLSISLGTFNLKVERCMNPISPSIDNNWRGVIQTFYHYDGSIYNRYMWRGESATSWNRGTWKVLNEHRGAFNTSSAYITDANNMTISGSYWVAGAYVSNLPVGSGWYGVLSTENPATDLYKQTFTAYNNGRTWVRQHTNGRWYAWFEICVNVQGTLANTLAINNANPAHTQSVTFSYIRQGFTATVFASFTFDKFTSSNTSTAGTYFFNGRSFEAELFGKNDGTITAYGNCVIGWGNSYNISRKANESIFIEGLTNASAKGQTAIAQIHLAYIAS